MSLLLNILWAVVGGGLITALEYFLVGVILCLTLVGIPFGLQCFKVAGLALAPFGKTFVPTPVTLLGIVGNLLWVILAGFWIFMTHVALALSLAVTIIGLPFALQHLKLAIVAFAPFDLEVESSP